MHKQIKTTLCIGFSLVLNACTINRYQAYESEEFPVSMDLRGTSKHTARAILDDYFNSHQFKSRENSHVYFLPCELKSACNEQVYTLVWTWDNEQKQHCNHGVQVLETNQHYQFEHEPVRCN